MTGLAVSQSWTVYSEEGGEEFARLDWIVGEIHKLAQQLHTDYGP
jgi:hypothetical protein